jgi:hypothetical protein
MNDVELPFASSTSREAAAKVARDNAEIERVAEERRVTRANEQRQVEAARVALERRVAAEQVEAEQAAAAREAEERRRTDEAEEAEESRIAEEEAERRRAEEERLELLRNPSAILLAALPSLAALTTATTTTVTSAPSPTPSLPLSPPPSPPSPSPSPPSPPSLPPPSSTTSDATLLAALPSLTALTSIVSSPLSVTPSVTPSITPSITPSVAPPSVATPSVAPPPATVDTSSDPAFLAALPSLAALTAITTPPAPSGSILGSIGSGLGYAASGIRGAPSAAYSYLKGKEITPESVPILLAALPTLTALVAATYSEQKETRFWAGTKGIAGSLGKAISSVFASKPKPTAITGPLLIEKDEWNLGTPSIKDLRTPDLKILNEIKLPEKAVHGPPRAIPAWVPKSVAAELDFDPACDVGGAGGPTCLPTTMFKHVEELDAYNKARSFSNGTLWASARNAFDKAAAGTSDSEKRAFAAAYPEKYPFFVKDASGNVPELVYVWSPYHKRVERAAGTFVQSNLDTLARIAPPEMIYSSTNNSNDVKFMSIALLESLAFCGTKKTLDDPDCEPLRILAELREFHAGQKASKAHYQKEASTRLSGPWSPIQRILNLIADYVTPVAPVTVTIPAIVPTVATVPNPVTAPKVAIVPNPTPRLPTQMPSIPFIIPRPFSTIATNQLHLPGPLGILSG